MKKVKALKVYRVKETGAIAHPGHILNYPEERALQLADGGWVEIIGDSEESDTEPAALTGVADNDAPPVDGEDGAAPDGEGSTDPVEPEEGEQPAKEEQPEEPATPVVPEKVEVVNEQSEKVEAEAEKGKRGRKPKTEK